MRVRDARQRYASGDMSRFAETVINGKHLALMHVQSDVVHERARTGINRVGVDTARGKQAHRPTLRRSSQVDHFAVEQGRYIGNTVLRIIQYRTQ